jgi:hypothetical protein
MADDPSRDAHRPQPYMTWLEAAGAALVIVALLAGFDVGGVRSHAVRFFQPNTIEGSSAVNGGTIAIAQPNSYTYNLTLNCPSANRAPSFRLQSDDGTTDYLRGAGRIYLGAGNWSGVPGLYVPAYAGNPLNPRFPPTAPTFNPYPCGWSLMLTPSG